MVSEVRPAVSLENQLSSAEYSYSLFLSFLLQLFSPLQNPIESKAAGLVTSVHRCQQPVDTVTAAQCATTSSLVFVSAGVNQSWSTNTSCLLFVHSPCRARRGTLRARCSSIHTYICTCLGQMQMDRHATHSLKQSPPKKKPSNLHRHTPVEIQSWIPTDRHRI